MGRSYPPGRVRAARYPCLVYRYLSGAQGRPGPPGRAIAAVPLSAALLVPRSLPA